MQLDLNKLKRKPSIFYYKCNCQLSHPKNIFEIALHENSQETLLVICWSTWNGELREKKNE